MRKFSFSLEMFGEILVEVLTGYLRWMFKTRYGCYVTTRGWIVMDYVRHAMMFMLRYE